MSRRTRLPGADELFRSTGTASRAEGTAEHGAAAALMAVPAPSSAAAEPEPVADLASESQPTRTAVRRRPRSTGERRPTGRERHEEKITVYVSAEELVDLERARLTLRAEHGLAIDRGRIVREALAVVLADLEAKGDASILVRRLGGR